MLLQTFASCADPDAGLLAYRQVSEALGGNQWYLRLLRDEGQVAERLAQLLGLQPVRRLAAHPRAGGAAACSPTTRSCEPRSADGAGRRLAAGGRPCRPTRPTAMRVLRGLRRQELLRIACADLLGRLDVVAGRARR